MVIQTKNGLERMGLDRLSQIETLETSGGHPVRIILKSRDPFFSAASENECNSIP